MSSTVSQNKSFFPRIILTPGEPAGIGPDLLIALEQTSLEAELIACCDPDLIKDRAKALGISIRLEEFVPGQTAKKNQQGVIKILPVKLNKTATAGRLEPANASYVLECLESACRGCLDGTFDAMTTGPIQKSVINDAGIRFSGHTEFLAEQCNRYPVMMLANSQLRVALVTTHLPLSEVASSITEEVLEKTLRIINQDLKNHFAISKPEIFICGLNPHAGEGGHLGMEEINIIEPVIKKLKRQGFSLTGPLPADTVFTKDYLQRADVIVSMFHDQGLPTLKALGFGETVNITLGLPIIRTSVDHGTALELAATGKAKTGSLMAAVKMAVELARSRHKQSVNL